MREQRICSIPECDRPSRKRGWCGRHYDRWWRHGDPLVVRLVVGDYERRFWERVQKTETDWLWTGRTSDYGYGLLDMGGKPVEAHRFAYELLVGPIPDGLTIDHVKANGCTSRACVKAIADEFGPAHLEPVTQGENVLRGVGFAAVNARKTHCVNGHEFTEINTYIRPNGWRDCLTCKRARQAAWEQRRRSA